MYDHTVLSILSEHRVALRRLLAKYDGEREMDITQSNQSILRKAIRVTDESTFLKKRIHVAHSRHMVLQF